MVGACWDLGAYIKGKASAMRRRSRLRTILRLMPETAKSSASMRGFSPSAMWAMAASTARRRSPCFPPTSARALRSGSLRDSFFLILLTMAVESMGSSTFELTIQSKTMLCTVYMDVPGPYLSLTYLPWSSDCGPGAEPDVEGASSTPAVAAAP